MAGKELDDFLFAEEADDLFVTSAQQDEPWPILVVDDDPQVHAMTRVILRDFDFQGRGFEVVSASSAAEARSILAQRADLPVALLDVVMETDDAGLRLVRYIREDLGNQRMRIILRTGQPGEAPERDVVLSYDINDYKNKTELTAQKLFTALVGALRSWQDLVAIERNRRGLEKLVNATGSLLDTRSMRSLMEAMVQQLTDLLDSPEAGVVACRDTERAGDRRVTVMAAAGCFAGTTGQSIHQCLPSELVDTIELGFLEQTHLFAEDHCLLVFRTLEHGTTVLLLQRREPLTEDEKRLLEVFCTHVAAGLDNACLYEDLSRLNKTLEQRVAARTAELKASRQALLEAKARIELALARETEAKQQQRQFLSMVSHEFRTPLAVIDSSAQMLAIKAESQAPTMLPRLDTIRSNVRRMIGLIDTCLADERLDTGRLELRLRDMDLTELLRGLVESHRAAAPSHSILLDMDCRSLPFRGDSQMLELAISNLLSNAVKYSSEVRVIELRLRAEGQGAVISVRDHGVGVPPAEQERIFERFFRGSNSNCAPGAGIGLHLVRQIAELHGGSVIVESEVGAGSTFSLVLPGEAPPIG
ncbi:DUF3369 domain-containing protein [Telmatospirillum sp. J64-1]|uniref:sensor histidine kinase n=1 Tax=Telmatospirillum sp. J64-1 TaxID=2502183 RepID=UPI00115F195E|nr:DUF3369 domain-containing protein [Telmatospirillum sp. J64-1]